MPHFNKLYLNYNSLSIQKKLNIMKLFKFISISYILITLSSCAVVRPGEIGVKQRFGKLKEKNLEPGLVIINPFTTRIVKIPTRTENQEVKLVLPSKEGLNVSAEISILYHIEKEKVIEIIKEVGKNYEKVLVLSTFRSAAADVSAQFLAKDMHSGMRNKIEHGIKEKMMVLLQGRGIVIEAVLMKSISLPDGLYYAIESKLKAEQEAQQMEFVLQREKQEAKRKLIEAEGIRDAQITLSEGLTDHIIKLRTIEAFEKLSKSPNGKVIITNGESPLLIK